MKLKLSLSVKFNLVFLLIFSIGLVAAGIVADRLLQKQALEETVHDANVLISAAGSMQNYTAAHITPLLATQIKYRVRAGIDTRVLGDRNAQSAAEGFPELLVQVDDGQPDQSARPAHRLGSRCHQRICMTSPN